MPIEFADFGKRLVLIAGPCVIESEEHVHRMARGIRQAVGEFVFKASFDKANRTSGGAYRGPGLQEGLRILAGVKAEGFPILTDIHEAWQAEPAAEVADILQIPAFLCRQTDLLTAAGRTGRIVNIKKGQFVAPHDIHRAAEKVASTGNSRVVLTERGSSFGYNNLVVDMRGLKTMRDAGWPVVFDATHSAQLPGGAGAASGLELGRIGHAADDRRDADSGHVTAVGGGGLGDLHRQLSRRRQDEDARAVDRALVAALRRVGAGRQDASERRQDERRGLAAAGGGGDHQVGACERRRNRSRLDVGGGGVTGVGDGADQGFGQAEGIEGHGEFCNRAVTALLHGTCLRGRRRSVAWKKGRSLLTEESGRRETFSDGIAADQCEQSSRCRAPRVRCRATEKVRGDERDDASLSRYRV